MSDEVTIRKPRVCGVKYQLLRDALLLAFAAASCLAQTTSQISGLVVDQNGSAVGGATISVVGAKLAYQRNLISDTSGSFTVPNLPPDSYQITASCPTCSDSSSIVEIGAGQTRSIQLAVDTASATTTVALETNGTTIDATSAKLGINVTATEIAALPVNGRALASLALPAPLVSNGGGATFSDLRFAGQSAQQNHYLLDGIDDSSVVSSEPGFVPLDGYQFRLRNSLDTVEEFRVDSVGYSAQDGSGNGGQIKLVSKSGSSAFHGSLFEYHRNDELQARNFFDGEDSTGLRMNQFGANIGGPLRRSKLFAFASFERLEQTTGLNILETVPSELLRSEAAPSILPALNAVPLGSQSTVDPDTDRIVWQSKAAQEEQNLSARFDYLATLHDRFFLRYSRSTGTLSAPDYSTTARFINADNRSDQTVASWTRQLNAQTTLQTTLGLNRSPTTVDVTSPSEALHGARVLVGNQTLGGVASPGDQILLADGNYGNHANLRGRTYNFQSSIDWLSGIHLIQAGTNVQLTRVPLSSIGGITYAYRDVESFVANQDADITYHGDLKARKALRETYGGYIQDQMHLGRGVQLLLGVRYEYFSATREAEDRAVLFDPASFTLQRAKGGFYRVSPNGFQPRAAITWSPRIWKGTTVFRLGSGIYNGQNAFFETLAPIENSTPRIFLAGSSFPATAAQVLGSSKAQLMPRSLDAGSFGRNQRNLLTTASWQQSLPNQFVSEIAYAGILSRHLTQRSLLNLSTGIDPVTGSTLRPDPEYTLVSNLINGGNSSYQALHLNLTRHLVDNLTVRATYGLSHSIGNTIGSGDEQLTANPVCLACETASNNFDTRHNASLSLVYGFPFGKGQRHLRQGWAGALLGGWTVAGILNVRSGLPVNVLINRSDEILYSPSLARYYSLSADGIPADASPMINAPYGLEGLGSLRPDLVPNVDPYKKNGTQWLNPEAFAVPEPGTLGNLGRNALRGPGFSQLDVQLTRRFSLREQLHLDLKVEAFNLLNHPNFSNPVSLLPDTTVDVQPGSSFSPAISDGFGALHSTVGTSIGLGTSRQFQLSARFEF